MVILIYSDGHGIHTIEKDTLEAAQEEMDLQYRMNMPIGERVAPESGLNEKGALLRTEEKTHLWKIVEIQEREKEITFHNSDYDYYDDEWEIDE